MLHEANTAVAVAGRDDSLLPQYLMLRKAAVDPALPKAAIAVLAVILEHYNRSTRAAYPGCDRIAKLTGIHRTSVLRSVELLENRGWLTVDRSPNRANEYRFDWTAPIPTNTGSSSATGSVDETGSTDARTGSVGAHDRSHPCTEPVAPVRPEPALNQLPNQLLEPEELLLAPLAEPAETESEFDRFFRSYPRKVGGKAKARKSWDRQKLDALADQIIDGVKLRAQIDPQWQDAKFIPHAVTFLNNQRWQDEWQTGTLAQRHGESRNDLIARLQQEAEERAVAKMCVVDRVAYYAAKGDERERAQGMRTVNRKPSATDNFTGKVYIGTPIDDLHPRMRDAVKRDLAEFEAAQAAKGWLDE